MINDAKAMVSLALGAVYQEHARAQGSLRLRVKPSKAAFATQRHDLGKLVLVPSTSSVLTWFEGADKSCPNGVALNAREILGKRVVLVLSPCAAAARSTGGVISPYWFVQDTHDREKANLEESAATTSVLVKCGQHKMSEAMDVPTYKNFKPVRAGEELVVYKPSATSGTRGSASSSDVAVASPAPKKRAASKAKAKSSSKKRA